MIRSRLRLIPSIMISILMMGCASTYRIDVTKTGDTVLENPAEGITNLRYRIIHVANKESLRSMVINRRNYRLDFFKQSKDPYFGTNRWSDRCIRQNRTEELKEGANGISFTSSVTADAKLKTEICVESSIDAFQIIGECKQTGILYEVTMTGPRAPNARFRCPDALVVP